MNPGRAQGLIGRARALVACLAPLVEELAEARGRPKGFPAPMPGEPSAEYAAGYERAVLFAEAMIETIEALEPDPARALQVVRFTIRHARVAAMQRGGKSCE